MKVRIEEFGRKRRKIKIKKSKDRRRKDRKKIGECPIVASESLGP
jgi:hypothetical protein